jgi:hypothetical protein
MNFPMDNVILRFLYWFVNTPGLGGLGVVFIVVACLGSFAAALRWIILGAQADESTTYAYPTSAFHDHN